MGKAFSIVERSHAEAKKFFGPRAIDCAVDATLGGGGDALFLASMLSEGGKIFGFDVQEEAVARSRALFEKNGILEKCTFFCSGHENMLELIPQKYRGKVGCVFFNLGWLPGSDKSVITELKSTAEALRSLRGLFVRRARAGEDSLLNVLSYRGHKGAAQEFEFVEEFFNSLEEGGTDLTGVAVSRFGDFENPESPVLFSARFFPEGRGDI